MLCIVLVFGLLPMPTFAAGEVFTMDKEYVSPDALPEDLTITSDSSNTFSTGETPSIFPTVVEVTGAGPTYGTAYAMTLKSHGDQEITATIPTGLGEGTYEVRVGDPLAPLGSEGGNYYEIGNLEIRAAVITSSAPVLSVPESYSEAAEAEATLQYSQAALGSTTVSIMDGSTEEASATVTDVNTSGMTKTVTFTVPTGLSSNTYDLKFETGSESVTLSGGLIVRGAASVSLDVSALNAGYSSQTVTAIGTETGFSSQTTVQVLDASSDDQLATSGLSVSDATDLSFTLNEGLSAGQTYTVVITTGSESVTDTIAVSTPVLTLKDENKTKSVSQVGRASDTVVLTAEGENTDFVSGQTLVSLLDGSNQTVSGAIVGSATVLGTSECQFTLNQDVASGSYTIQIVTGNQSVSAPLTIVSPTLSDVSFSSQVGADGSYPSDYLSVSVTVTGVNTSFSSNSKVTIDGSSANITQMSADSDTQLSFVISSGLSVDAHEIEVDVDGSGTSSYDTFDSGDLSSLSIDVVSGSVSDVSPSNLVYIGGAKDVTITGTNTFFNTDGADLSVTVRDDGTPIGSVSDVRAEGDNLIFNFDPSSITSDVTLDVQATLTSGSYSKTFSITDALSISTKGVDSLSPTTVYTDEIDSVSIDVTGIGTSFNSGTLVRVDGDVLSSSDVVVTDGTHLTFTVPTDLAVDSHTLQITDGSNLPETSFLVMGDRDVTLSPSMVRMDYGATQVIIDGDNLDFSVSSNIPGISISGGGGSNWTPTAVHDSGSSADVAYFNLPSDMSVDSYQVSLDWNNGLHDGLSLSKSLTVDNRYSGIEIRRSSNAVTSLSLTPSSGSVTLSAYGIEIDGGAYVNITDKADWTLLSGSGVISLADNVVTVLDDGYASIQVAYDAQVKTLAISIVEESTPDDNTGGGSSSGGGGGGGGGGGAPAGDSTVTVETPTDDALQQSENKSIQSPSDKSKAIQDVAAKVVAELAKKLTASNAGDVLKSVTNEVFTTARNVDVEAREVSAMIENTAQILHDAMNKGASQTDIKATLDTLIKSSAEVLKSKDSEGVDTKVAVEAIARVVNKQISEESKLMPEVNVNADGESVLAVNTASVNEGIQKLKQLRTDYRVKMGQIGAAYVQAVNPVLKVDLGGESVEDYKFELDAYSAKTLADEAMTLGVVMNDVVVNVPVEMLAAQTSDQSIQIENKSMPATEFRQNDQTGEFTLVVYDMDVKVTGVQDSTVKTSIQFKVPTGLPKALESALGVYVEEADGTWAYVPSQKNGNTLEFTPPHFSIYALRTNSVEFSDMTGHWAESAAETMAAKHVVSGVGNGMFAPNAQVTRAEFATMLVKYLGLEKTKTAGFSDVPADAWYAEYVDAAAENGLISGMGDGRFDPLAPVTREQVAAMICNAYNYDIGSEMGYRAVEITDADMISTWAQPFVHTVLYQELDAGYEDGSFKAQNAASRAESISMIFNLMNQ